MLFLPVEYGLNRKSEDTTSFAKQNGISDSGAKKQNDIQLLNAAAETNQFARSLIANINLLQDALAQGESGGKMNRFGMTTILARTSLLPKNSDLVGDLDEFLTELRVSGNFWWICREGDVQQMLGQR